jgi:ABC-type multidrug transport system fused ATPase/permease subunit
MQKKLNSFISSISSDLRKKLYKFIFLSLCSGFLEMLGVGLVFPLANFIFSNDSNSIDYLPFFSYVANISDLKPSIILIFILVFFFTIKNFFLIFINNHLYKILAQIRHGISCDIFNKYIDFKYDFFLQKNSAEITRNLTSVVNDLNTSVIVPAGILISEISILFFISLIVLYLSFTTSLLMLVTFIVPFYFYNNFLKRKLNYFGLVAQQNESFRIDKINQMIGGIKEIKILNKEHYFMEWYKKYDKSVAESHRVINTYTQSNKYLLELVLIFSLSILILHALDSENLDINKIIPFLAVYTMAAFKVMPSLNRINNSLQALRWGGNVIEIVQEIIEKKGRAQQARPKGKPLTLFSHSIQFKNVSFKYSKDSRYVLKNLNINIRKGDVIGITGNSGSGKSTFLNLMLGILRPSKGVICIDGIDIHRAKISQMNLIGFVPQDVFLSDSSILSNVAFGTNLSSIDRDRVVQCLKDARIYDFVMTQKRGINTKVGDRGIRLSGGQKQRLAIARSLYFGAQILILDEATSALDYDTETEIMKTINYLNKKYTVILVAHRLNTLKNCNYIYKIHNSKLLKVNN